MSYHRGGQAGAVAVSYSTSPMAPHSPSRRCSSGNSGNTSSSIGNSTSKLSTYRSTAPSSILDRPTNFYSSSSTSGSSGFRSNYTTEYRRSYCPSGSFYSSANTSIRRSYVSEYSRSRSSPTRSVSSSTYNSTGSSGGTAANVTTNGTSGSRFGLSTSSSSSNISVGSSSRDRGIPESRLEIAADLISSGGGDACDSGQYGIINNNDREHEHSHDPDHDHDPDDDHDKDDDDEDDEDNKLNNRHHRQQQQQRGAAYRIDEVSPAKRNLLSPVLGGGAGVAGLIGVKLNLFTNLATNPSNGGLLINNNARKNIQGVKEEEEDIDIEDETARGGGEVIHGIKDVVTSIDVISFLRGGRTGDPESLEDSEQQRKTSTSYGIDQTGFVGGSTPPILQNGVAGRPSGTYGDDPSVPSTSRRPDGHLSGTTANTASNLTSSSSPTAPSTAHQNLYRGVADQFEGSPTNKTARNRLQAHRDERCGLNGLRNIGNTCFMNSVIQCLSNTRPLLEYLLNEQYLADINTSTSSMKGALIKAFSQVIHELWEVGGDLVVNTTALKSQIQRFAPRFMGYSQQDAQEFLRYLLEGLHEDVNRVTVKPQPIHTDIPEMYTDSQKAVESWKRYLRSEDSMIVDVFVGQLRSSLHCTSCDHVSVTLDPFWDLSLPIPARSGTVKLSQCLEHFTREEVLDGDEKPTCSKCQMRRKCTKSFSIQKFPKILVIHLKRFSPMERFRSKLNVMVDFPLTGLDLSAFAAPRVPGCTYNLYGVANHSGTTHSGHYTAYCKHPYSGEWHEYNDSRVSVVPARSVVSNEAYVLFYEQQPHSSHL
ncbi:ubiquitin carboxyl-terminal hydrolase 4-like isoform X3 [Bombus vosnesenskii]|uniref:Ubiquitin carboxyl-terminal hydrolase n=1 Tax=Bombus vosnesenskii TaxID=207650 RepID=A0A6J3KQB5_9HYME|nr:ubiquitin carboxyl-terminal hydrolase 4-like isoform X3 [Bombus vosnesenskii]XP_050492887.1 uncharacterized protein LOC126874644 isoform X3 [Bombus huntii]